MLPARNLIPILRALVRMNHGRRGGYGTLERELGLAHSTLSRFVSGKQTLSADGLVALMTFLSVGITYRQL